MEQPGHGGRLNPADWQQRFLVQASWTAALRAYLYQKTGLLNLGCVLEVGCGPGVIAADLLRARTERLRVHALDLDLPFLRQAQRLEPALRLVQADGARMPYPPGVFDAAVCHYLLLWAADPAALLGEMARVTRPGGWLLALAEPDYGGRVDFPPELARLGTLQAESLRGQGADPFLGRRLSALFHGAGLRGVETGVMGGQWRQAPASAQIDSEWAVLRSDLVGHPGLHAGELDWLEQVDRAAWASGERILFVPTFYAIGQAA